MGRARDSLYRGGYLQPHTPQPQSEIPMPRRNPKNYTKDDLLDIIKAAYLALAASSSPSLTKKQQQASLGECYDLLSAVVYGD